MFVAITLNDILQGGLETILLDQLLLLRFPVYYVATFACLGGVWLCLLGAVYSAPARSGERRGGLWSLGLASAACFVLVVDYGAVYLPLRDLLLPLGSPRTPAFRVYHRWSEGLNLVTFVLMLALALRLNFWNPPACRPHPAARAQ